MYTVASGLSAKAQDVQAATFLHVIGNEAHEVVNTFTFDSDDDKKKITKLQGKIEACCNPKKNVTLERHALLSRRQGSDEPLDEN